MSSISALQDRVQFDEGMLPGLLQGLKAKTVNDQKITEGTYKTQDDADGTGEVLLKKGVDDTNTAWIKGVETNITIEHP